MVIGLFFLSSLVIAFFCDFLAREKNRNGIAWFFLGLCFNIVALLALIGVPAKSQSFLK